MPRILTQPSETLADFIRNNVPSDEFYQKRFPKWNPKSPSNQLCPFHSEKTGSFAVNLRNGGARCHGCGVSLGNIVHFQTELGKQNDESYSESRAARDLYIEFIRPIFPKFTVERFHSTLQTCKGVIRKIRDELGLTVETIERFKLGWDTTSKRLVIPIRSPYGFWSYVRYYKLPSERSSDPGPKIYNAKGYGHSSLFPFQVLNEYRSDRPLFWLKAERDAMLAYQDGLQAICTTGGGEAVSIEPYAHQFADYDITIIADKDETGRREAKKKFDILSTEAKSVKIIELDTKEKDYSDWRLVGKKPSSHVSRIAPIQESSNASNDSKSDKKIPMLSNGHGSNGHSKIVKLNDLRHDMSIQNTPVQTKALIVGVVDRNFLLPNHVKFNRAEGFAKEFKVDVSRDLIGMMFMSDKDVDRHLKQIGKIKTKEAKVEKLSFITATEVELCPLVEFNSEGDFITYKAVFVGEKFKTNTPYLLDILPTTSIKNQEQVGIVTKATATDSVIDTKKFSENEVQRLTVFRNNHTDPDEFWSELCNFASDIAQYHTRVFNRLDSHLIALLTWLCPLYFNYPNEGRQRGWLNSLILGDTQTGKSKVAQCLQRSFNCGTFVNAENCTFMGLVGGAAKNANGQFILRWGRLPVNDRQLVVVEELSGISTQDISRMSEVRSSGIARLDKGGITAETNARCRLLVLSNVRGFGRSVGSYPSGVRAVLELVGQIEDVSRFDLITTLTDDEVSSQVINQEIDINEDDSLYHDQDLQLLVRFIWCLKPEQIEVTHEAYLASLQITKDMAKVYHPSVPVFKAGSGRILLTRVACAIACATFAWDRSRELIVVTELHVQTASRLLRMLYDKDSFGYLRYSKREFEKTSVKDTSKLENGFAEILKSKTKQSRVLHFFSNTGDFEERELMTVGGIWEMETRRIIGLMLDANIISKVPQRNAWRLTKEGRKWIEKQV